MFEFLIDSIFAWWTVVIRMAINCAPLHTALLLYWYEGDFNFIFRYIDDVFLLNNRFDDFVDRIYHMELETKNTTDTATWHAPRNRQWWRFVTKLYDKRDYFNIPFKNFPFICSNIPSTPAYGVYISWLILYRAGISSQDFQAANKKATWGKVPSGHVDVIISEVLRLPPWLVWPLQNICVTHDHGYVLFVLITILSFPHS